MACKWCNALRGLAVAGFALTGAGSAWAQIAPATPPLPSVPNPPGAAPRTPNAETPPGGIARGVVPAPHGVDPGMVAPPPAGTLGSMPVIKPPVAAR